MATRRIIGIEDDARFPVILCAVVTSSLLLTLTSGDCDVTTSGDDVIAPSLENNNVTTESLVK